MKRCLKNTKKIRKKNASVYTFTLDDKYDLNGDLWYNLAKYFNHSCDGNCESCSEEDNSIVIYALKNIKKGEELTYNYGYDVENYKDHPCRSGSKKCVGYIVSENQWKKLEKLKTKENKNS